jgi:multimeric flavodoxin WrbA
MLMNVLAVTGSPRKNANSAAMARAALDGAQETGAVTELVRLKDYAFSSCIGCEKCRADKACTGLRDGMSLLYPKIEAARGMVLCSPVHNYNVTAMIKAFIDRLYCYYDFDMENRPRAWSSRLAGQGRKAVLMAVAEQESKHDMGVVFEAMRLPMTALGYEIVAEVPVLAIFDAGRVKNCEDIVETCRKWGKRLGDAVRD